MGSFVKKGLSYGKFREERFVIWEVSLWEFWEQVFSYRDLWYGNLLSYVFKMLLNRNFLFSARAPFRLHLCP